MYNFGIAIAVISVLKLKELNTTEVEDVKTESFPALQTISSVLVYGGFVIGAIGVLGGLLGLDTFDEQWKAIGLIVSGIVSAIGLSATGYTIKVLLQIEENTRK